MIRNITVVFLFSIFLFIGFSFTKTVLAFDCLMITSTSPANQKTICQNELNQLLQEQATLEAQLKDQQKQTGTLKGDVTALTTQINALKTKVKARALAIAQLKVSIKEKNTKILTLTQKIEVEKESLAQLIRKSKQIDDKSFIEYILSGATIAEAYGDISTFESINEAIKKSVDQIKGVKTETEVQKKDLEKKQNAETDAKIELESAQKKVTQSEAEKKRLLAISVKDEATYQKLAAEKRARADKIRSALFNLAGTSQKIDFGTALKYANEARDKVGIDPAFLLAILTQESNLGANVGQCYLTNPDTGAGVGKNTGTPFKNVMKPTRDVQPFLAITKSNNLDPYKTAVSCPIAGIAGYGGAMGPAQFIPSTWKLFEGRLRSALGHEPNPWSPEDAFMASSMYLTDLGAIGNSASGQNKAACKYYGSGGATCSYSKSVASLKSKIQANIDLLSN